MMKKLLLIISVALLTYSGYAQKHKIEVQVKGLSDTTLLLGYHYGEKKLVADTIRVDSKGRGVFEGDSLLDGGLYLVLTPNLRYFELIIDKDQEFKVVTDTADLFANLQIEGSLDNQVFLDYQKKSGELYKKRKPVYDQLKAYYDIKDSTGLSTTQKQVIADSIKILQDNLTAIQKEMMQYEDENIIKKYPKGLLTSILLCTRDIDIPDYPRNEKVKSLTHYLNIIT